MCGKIMTVLLIFVLIVLNCAMALYNGRLHCIVGVLPTSVRGHLGLWDLHFDKLGIGALGNATYQISYIRAGWF